jgi:hypothetical protein
VAATARTASAEAAQAAPIRPAGSIATGLIGGLAARLRAAYALSLLTDVVCGAVVLLLCSVLVMWLTDRVGSWPIRIGLVCCAAAVVGAVALIRRVRPTPVIAARVADERLAAPDVFASIEAARGTSFETAVLEQADQLATHQTPAKLLPFRVQWWKVAAPLVGLCAIAFLANVSGPGARERSRKAEDRKRIERAVATVDSVRKALDRSGQLTPATAAQLEDLRRELDRQTDPLAAAKSLDAAAAAIAPQDKAGVLARRAAAKGLARSLSTSPLARGANAEEQLRNAAEQCVTDPVACATTVERLKQLAALQDRANPELAASLREAATALERGDSATAREALDRAAAEQSKATQQVAADRAANDASAQLSAGASELAGQPQPGSIVSGSIVSGSIVPGGTGPVVAVSSVPPGVSTSVVLVPGSGIGNGATGAVASGTVVQPGSGKQAGSGGAASIGAPSSLAPTGARVFVPGTPSGPANGAQAGTGAAPSAAGGGKVPVGEVAPAASAKATKALESSELDPAEQDVVQNYFDQLTGTPSP